MEPLNEVKMFDKSCCVLAENKTRLQDRVSLSKGYDFKTVCGIDTLYCYYPSNASYCVFFEKLEQEILSAKELNGGYIPKDTLRMNIGEKEFFFNGISKGFYYFIDTARWFRIGLKHPKKNTNLLDIQVQCEATGIYTVGLVRLVRHIEALLSPIANPSSELTRLDPNIFVQCDLSQIIEKDYIVTKKRKNRREDGGRKGYQSLKIGDHPFLNRLYDKRIELKGKDKEPLMNAYFVSRGFDLNKPIWNFEFELHRDFFKRYGIRTVEDALQNVDVLFHLCMKHIRLIDKTTLSQKDIDASRLHRGKIHPLWEYLDASYHFDAVPQSLDALEKVLPQKSVYDSKALMDELSNVFDKAAINDVYLSEDDVKEIIQKSHLWLSGRIKKLLKPFKPIPLYIDGVNYVLSKNNTPIKTIPANLEYVSTKELQEWSSSLMTALHIEMGEKNWDISLIMKNFKEIEHALKNRKHEQKELELWQA